MSDVSKIIDRWTAKIAELEGRSALMAVDCDGLAQVLLLASRTEAVETKLAAVPVDAMRRYLRYSDVPDHHHRYPDAEQQADRAVIALWLAQQPEVTT